MEVLLSGRPNHDVQAVADAFDTVVLIEPNTTAITFTFRSDQAIWYSYSGLINSWIRLQPRVGEVLQVNIPAGVPAVYLRKAVKRVGNYLEAEPVLLAAYTVAGNPTMAYGMGDVPASFDLTFIEYF